MAALLTDFYQITMAYAYFKLGMAETKACFHLSFRKAPFQGNYALVAGLEQAIELMRDLQFTQADLDFLAAQTAQDHQPLFDDAFLNHLRDLRFSCDVDAMPEGTIAFAHEPLLRITGPILQCQLLETPLLNTINFQTLIATKAARISQAAGDKEVIDFGLRRAQGPNGALSASRAAYIGGCSSTSNTLAAQRYGILAKGTLAHSFVMAFPDEREAFAEFAKTLPHHAVLLVDTYDTHTGVDHAIEIGKKLRATGQDLLGIRLDSGDLAELSKMARARLDQAGFFKTRIIVSGDLDEHKIAALVAQKAPIDAYGVGTRLITAYDGPALGGVYKLAAIQSDPPHWRSCIKISDDPSKATYPGILQVRRTIGKDQAIRDVILDQSTTFASDDKSTELLVPIFRAGQQVYATPSLAKIQAYAKHQLEHTQLPFTVTFHPALIKAKQDLSQAMRRAE